MAINNHVHLSGRLGKDIEIKVAGEHKVAQISMAIKKSKDEVQWLYVNVWDNQAEYLDRFAKKGTMIAIDGRINVRNYTDKDGHNRNQMQIDADEVQILTDWRDSKKAKSNEIVIDDEELPFY